MTAPDQPATFEELLGQNQRRIFAFIFSLTGNRELSLEVFQETNLVLVRKKDLFDPNKTFLPWAFAIARNQVRAAFQKTYRDKMVVSEEAMELVEKTVVDHEENFDQRQTALTDCLAKLSESQRQLIEQKYRHGESLDSIARSRNQSSNRLAVALFRIRKLLADCIQRKMEVCS
ncbi:MAG: sigma-70 family RNA polymerase sigma factor [Planctomycetota bacterium]|nr:sigma-70 family RNA polymerase sigma factor [Planctomycetota bacterium]